MNINQPCLEKECITIYNYLCVTDITYNMTFSMKRNGHLIFATAIVLICIYKMGMQ
jgi:hypothetical protein